MAVSVIVFGCGPTERAEDPTYAVSGTVTLDGEPLAEGEIYFLTPAEGQVDILSIENGKFEGEAKAGSRRVEIRAYKMEEAEVPADMPGLELEPSKVNYLPAAYNTESTLTADVSDSKPNEFTFELTSK